MATGGVGGERRSARHHGVNSLLFCSLSEVGDLCLLASIKRC